MEDTARARSRIVGQKNEFVVRQFLPARVERSLLTRLFDLTTDRHVPGESSIAPSHGLQTVEAVDERREAA